VGQIKASEKEGLVIDMPGSPHPLRSHTHQYQRIHVELGPGPGEAWVTATLDFTGDWGGREVSSLGFERLAFEKKDGEWVPRRSLAPRLSDSLLLLEKRRQAFEAGSLDALRALYRLPTVESPGFLEGFSAVRDRKYRVSAWYLRSERDGGQAREEYRFEGTLPDKPVDEKAARTLEWESVDGRLWLVGELR
jgi:hypothetical protein